jgi:Tfp pilus assembly protein PilE
MDQQPIQTQSAPPADPGAHYQMPATNPGQTTGIIGLIFAFIGLAPIGLILSIVSTVQSSKGKASKALGIIGIVLNAIGMFVMAFFALIVLASYSNISERAADSEAQSAAMVVTRKAETYYAEHGNYPQQISDFARYDSSRLDSELVVVSGGALEGSEVSYHACGATGAQVAYLKSSSTIPITTYLGTGSRTSCR